MNPKWVGWLALVWLCGVILGATSEEYQPADWEERVSQTKMNYLLNFENTTCQQSSFGVITFPLPNPQYFITLLNVATMNFEFLSGEGFQFVRWGLQTFALMGILSFIWSATELLQGFIPFT